MNPITFNPLYMECVWGGREFERVYHRSLSDSVSPFGESWEIVDREGEQSVVDEGPLAGKETLQKSVSEEFRWWVI